MRRIITALVFPFLLAAAPASRDAVLKQYCVTCHNQRVKTGGVDLGSIPSDDPAAHPEVWEKVVRKITAGEMPPAGMPSPA
jgi:cytochrome c551/c552